MDFDLAQLSDLKDKDFSRQGLMALEGRIVIEKAIEKSLHILGIVRSEESANDWIEHRAGAIPVTTMEHEALCTLAGFRFHHGAIAIAERPEVPPFMAHAAQEARLLCLWNITDPSNVGALIRSAAGLGASGVLLGPGCADPFYRKALRASMGNAFSVPLFSCDESSLRAAAGSGVSLVAAALTPEARNLRDVDTAGPLILILGNEGYGLPQEVLALCSATAVIPMAAGVDSLNVVVAGGICMYELFGRTHGKA
jgi:tRNA G18 (ribose-2'-O)-methylase SpoU